MRRLSKDEIANGLDRLRLLARHRGRRRPGRVEIGPSVVHYADAASLYMQFKDIFCRRIYHFVPSREPQRIIDGGACVGMSALYFRTVYPTARILCFEPDPEIFSILEQNVRDNQLEDIELFQTGLASRAGLATFHPDGADGGRISDGDGEDVVIPTVVLSDYLTPSVDFLKLNVEGLELPVLLEAEATGRLAKVEQLVLEYHGWAGAEQRLGAILDLLDRQRYRYLVHDFDRETCSATKPPFRLTEQETWFCLVYARRLANANDHSGSHFPNTARERTRC